MNQRLEEATAYVDPADLFINPDEPDNNANKLINTHSAQNYYPLIRLIHSKDDVARQLHPNDGKSVVRMSSDIHRRGSQTLAGVFRHADNDGDNDNGNDEVCNTVGQLIKWDDYPHSIIDDPLDNSQDDDEFGSPERPSTPSPSFRLANCASSSVSLVQNHDQQQPGLMKMRPGFKVVALAVRSCVRLLHIHLIRSRVLQGFGFPGGRFRVCVYVVVSIIRLRITLPQLKKLKQHYLKHLRLQVNASKRSNYGLRQVFQSHASVVFFCSSLALNLRKQHTLCSPLNLALDIISQTCKLRLDQALNRGKCKVLLQVFSSISSYLNAVRFVLDNIQLINNVYDNTDTKNKWAEGLSVCYYALKELCRWLLLCKQYVLDCTGYLPSRKVFAKLESVETIKFLILDLTKCFRFLEVKMEALIRDVCQDQSDSIKQFSSDPALMMNCRMQPPGLFVGYVLHLQAQKDRSLVLVELKQQHQRPYHNWVRFINWTNKLTAAEESALAKHLLVRLSYDMKKEDQALKFLKEGLFVDRNHVKVVRFLGAGTYGKVEEVVCFGERYAMKTIKGLNTIEDVSEAVIQARLQHPNILKLIWYTKDYESDNSLSLLIEMMGCDLETFIEQQGHFIKGRLFNYPLVALDIIIQIAEAMRYLHSQGVMHRDLKAANVLVDYAWSPDAFKEGYIHVKVADFGLAKAKLVGGQSLHTYKVGTKYWRAPEVFCPEYYITRLPSSTSGHHDDSYRGLDDTQMQGNAAITDAGASELNEGLAKYSFSADVYSFAMTCFEILSGKKPFADARTAGLKERIVKLQERPILPVDVHPRLKELIHQCWDGMPENRPSFEVICGELQHIKHELLFGRSHL